MFFSPRGGAIIWFDKRCSTHPYHQICVLHPQRQFPGISFFCPNYQKQQSGDNLLNFYGFNPEKHGPFFLRHGICKIMVKSRSIQQLVWQLSKVRFTNGFCVCSCTANRGVLWKLSLHIRTQILMHWLLCTLPLSFILKPNRCFQGASIPMFVLSYPFTRIGFLFIPRVIWIQAGQQDS